MYRENSKDQSLLKMSPVITEISQQGSPYFLTANVYPFPPQNAEQFVPGPSVSVCVCMCIHVHVCVWGGGGGGGESGASKKRETP